MKELRGCVPGGGILSTLKASEGAGYLPRFQRQPAQTIFSLIIVAKVILLFILAWNTRFVMDEFVQLGWAKYLGNGLFETVWHPKAVGYVIFYKLAHLIGWDAT